MMLFSLLAFAISAWAGVENVAVVDGVVQSWNDTQVELLSHDRLIVVPRTAFKSPVTEGKRVRVLVPVADIHPSPREQLRRLQQKAPPPKSQGGQ